MPGSVPSLRILKLDERELGSELSSSFFANLKLMKSPIHCHITSKLRENVSKVSRQGQYDGQVHVMLVCLFALSKLV